jgi:uncharacterized protein YkvS
MVIEQEICIKIAPRGDGGIRVWSDDVPGLILSGLDPLKVIADIGPALAGLSGFSAAKQFSVGDRVEHMNGNRGTVSEILNDGSVCVKFDSGKDWRGEYDIGWFIQWPRGLRKLTEGA